MANGTGPKKCPACALISEPGVDSCDCGYSFSARRVKTGRAHIERISRMAPPYRAIVVIFGLTAVTGILPQEIAVAMALPLLALGALNCYRLAQALELSNPGGWAFAFIVPVVLFVLIWRANKFFKRHGLDLGLFGPSQQAIESLKGSMHGS